MYLVVDKIFNISESKNHLIRKYFSCNKFPLYSISLSRSYGKCGVEYILTGAFTDLLAYVDFSNSGYVSSSK